MEYKYYKQVQPERAIQGNFSSGQLDFRFSLNNRSTWVPARTYLKIKMKITKGDDSLIDKAFGLAPNMFICDNLFQQMDMRLNGTIVSEWNDYIAQCATLKHRLYKDLNERESHLSSINYSQISIHDRINEIATDGQNPENRILEQFHPGNQLSTISYALPSTALSIADLNLQAINGRIIAVGDTIAIASVPQPTATWIDVGLADLVDIRDIYRVGDIVNYQTAGPVSASFVIISFVNALVANIVMNQVVIASLATAIGATHSVIRHYNPYENGGNIIGVNTFFLSEIDIGDILLDKDTDTEYKVTDIIDDITINVFPPPQERIDATDNWCILRQNPSQRAHDIELIWRPPLGFFDITDMLSGDYKLELTPHAEGVWQKHAVEGLTNRAVGTTADDFKIEITEINMYIWKCINQNSLSGQKSYTYSDIRCNSQNLTTNSLTSKIFNVSEKNHSLTLAYQDSSAGDDIRFSRSKFKIANDAELKLVRYYIQKDGITIPDPIPSLEKNTSTGINRMTQRYYENFAYSDADRQLIKKETLRDWFDAGIFFHYKWGKGYKVSDQVQIYSNFSEQFAVNPQILLFDHYKCTISMKIVNGTVVGVSKS